MPRADKIAYHRHKVSPLGRFMQKRSDSFPLVLGACFFLLVLVFNAFYEEFARDFVLHFLNTYLAHKLD
jgi:hypothetical protein